MTLIPPSLWMQPVLYWYIVDDLFFGDSAEGLIAGHDVTDAFDEVYELNPYVPAESIARLYTNNHGTFWVHPGQEDIHG